VPLDVTLQHVEPADMAVVTGANLKLFKARRELTVADYDDILA
jgi:hypothetical protein